MIQIPVSEISISTIDSGASFSSSETPLVYSKTIDDNSLTVSVIAPFNARVNSNENPIISAVIGEDGSNDVAITPQTISNEDYSNIYTKIVLINFRLDNISTENNQAAINVTLNEETQPDNPDRLGAPLRKTKILANPA